ncbi:hypothetical protein [Nonomuraea ferruginea]|uniref:Uncharacterized protein n=1 Tax=Nonomuraea ferruginea TaxID=46174 RepID=A0ABT4ST54_9ACTN|nr:hypothetical protein [Nonomuraea ferruginea]MDA0640449.1 hypothetical protein [Nonomuraea ferruginea]
MDEATPMPGPVRTARILLWIYIGLMALIAALIFFFARYAPAGPDTSQIYLITGWSAALLVLTAFLTIKLTARRRWARFGLIAIMAMNVLGYLANLAAGGGLSLPAIVGLGLAIGVIVHLFRQDSRAYLDQ